jgi:predicted amidophosphoribosyltransferase
VNSQSYFAWFKPALFRHCGLCSRWSGSVDLYCEACWRNLFSHIECLQVNLDYDLPFPIYSLFRWTQDFPQAGDLVRVLKGAWAENAWNRLAAQFARQYCVANPIRSLPSVLVPAPSKNFEEKDHAQLWAESLSGEFSWPVSKALTRATLGDQKRKDRKERWLTHLQTSDSFDLKAKSYIFVDDLITTGATAQAAWIALGKPIHYEVWTLACRPRLSLSRLLSCEDKGVLI